MKKTIVSIGCCLIAYMLVSIPSIPAVGNENSTRTKKTMVLEKISQAIANKNIYLFKESKEKLTITLCPNEKILIVLIITLFFIELEKGVFSSEIILQSFAFLITLLIATTVIFYIIAPYIQPDATTK